MGIETELMGQPVQYVQYAHHLALERLGSPHGSVSRCTIDGFGGFDSVALFRCPTTRT